MSSVVPSYDSKVSSPQRVGDEIIGAALLPRRTLLEAPPLHASPVAQVPQRAPELSASGQWTPTWAPLLLQWRWRLAALWVLMHILAFNGQWRIGSDSAIFRSVAHSLATGEGYAILGEPQRQVYPGLPFMLAGLEQLFGPVVWPPVLLMLLMSVGVLWFTYRLISRVAPPWVASLVTLGVAFNAAFVMHGHELLTDLPFLLGMLMALWGWETLTDPGLGRRLRSATWLAVGLSLAAAMRPTFWVLALSFMLVCMGGLFVGLFPRLAPRRWIQGPDRARTWRFYAACLALVVLIGLLFAIFDPRTRSLDLLAGGYEAEMADRVLSPMDRLREAPGKLWEMLEDHLVALFFAERVEILNLGLAACVLVGVVLVAKRRPLWALCVIVLLATVYLASSSARYFLMVLPILWLGWVLLACSIASHLFKDTRWRSRYVAAAAGVVLLCNLGHDVKLIIEQRSQPFLEGYKDGHYAAVAAMARLIADVTAPQERIIGPYAPEMTYLSSRRVLGARALLTGREPSVRARAQAVQESAAQWAVFPATLYERKDTALYRLGRDGVFVPSNPDDSTTYSAGVFDGAEWYLTRDWAIDETMIPTDKPVKKSVRH